eukprot:PhF_6_TR42098/c0_g2_i1/m.63547
MSSFDSLVRLSSSAIDESYSSTPGGGLDGVEVGCTGSLGGGCETLLLAAIAEEVQYTLDSMTPSLGSYCDANNSQMITTTASNNSVNPSSYPAPPHQVLRIATHSLEETPKIDVDVLIAQKQNEHNTYADDVKLASPYSSTSSFHTKDMFMSTCHSLSTPLLPETDMSSSVFMNTQTLRILSTFMTCRDLVRLSMVCRTVRKDLLNSPDTRCRKLLAQRQCEVRLTTLDDRECVFAVKMDDTLHDLKVTAARQFSVHPWEQIFVYDDR